MSRENWFRSIRCAFPLCNCVGFCGSSPEARRQDRLERLKEACTFPDCVCRVGCSYMAYLHPTSALPRKTSQRRLCTGNTITSPVLVEALGSDCPYCGHMMSNDPRRQPTRDHIDPVSKDGKDDPSNVHVTCVTCNGDKGNLTLVAWYFELHEAGDLRARHVAQFLKTWRPQQQAPEEALGR